MSDPRFAIRYRSADGEFYVYVEDQLEHRIAGFTVFNRLIELDKRADRYIRGPHSRFDPPTSARAWPLASTAGRSMPACAWSQARASHRARMRCGTSSLPATAWLCRYQQQENALPGRAHGARAARSAQHPHVFCSPGLVAGQLCRSHRHALRLTMPRGITRAGASRTCPPR
ncbi:hypothetical protein [Comamonas sp. JC664]|uniref:hypothetical protein n=1 Tax=Comamonas sp. JC664 TaxID=2801917 RepID=UPI0036720A98